MANYNHTLDLMATIGSRIAYLKVRDRKEGETDEEYAKVPVLEYACIPTSANDITVTDDNSAEQYRNFSGKHARIAFSEFDLSRNSKLVQATLTRLMQRGEQETAYNVPCRELRPRYRKDWQDAARKRYEAQLKAQHPEWANLSDQGASLPQGTERNDLTRAINAKFPYSLGTGYLRESQQAQQASPYVAQPTAQYTQPAAQYAAPTESPYDDGYDPDLPF